MWINTLDPILVHLGPLEIRWYGIVYVIGFLLSTYWLLYLCKKGKLPLTSEQVWDLTFYLMLGVVLGARLFMIAWNPQYYLTNPLRLLKIWEGGMSFHGGFIGIVVAGWIYCKQKNLRFLQLADIICAPAMLALSLGRVTNFINGELIGHVTSVSWCVVFPSYDDLCRHPSTLYSAGARFVTSIWLGFLAYKEKFREGFIFWNFVLLEGIGRFLVDFFREDPLYLWLSLGQWLSVLMIVVSVIALTRYRKSIKKE